jgi:hypothetical protein
MARYPGMHDELVLIDQSQLRQDLRMRSILRVECAERILMPL